jgi:hypothetical protein
MRIRARVLAVEGAPAEMAAPPAGGPEGGEPGLWLTVQTPDGASHRVLLRGEAQSGAGCFRPGDLVTIDGLPAESEGPGLYRDGARVTFVDAVRVTRGALPDLRGRGLRLLLLWFAAVGLTAVAILSLDGGESAYLRTRESVLCPKGTNPWSSPKLRAGWQHACRNFEGEMHGPWTMWSEKGQLLERGSYRAGRKHGRFVEWNRSGVKRHEGQFVDGQRQGKEVRYREDDSTLSATPSLAPAAIGALMARRSAQWRWKGKIEDDDAAKLVRRFCGRDDVVDAEYVDYGHPVGQPGIRYLLTPKSAGADPHLFELRSLIVLDLQLAKTVIAEQVENEDRLERETPLLAKYFGRKPIPIDAPPLSERERRSRIARRLDLLKTHREGKWGAPSSCTIQRKHAFELYGKTYYVLLERGVAWKEANSLLQRLAAGRYHASADLRTRDRIAVQEAAYVSRAATGRYTVEFIGNLYGYTVEFSFSGDDLVLVRWVSSWMS